MRESLHFSHGNGFPSPCYRQLLNALGRDFDCYYIDRVGHDAEYPVTDNWEFLVSEVIASIKSQAFKPVIGVGHSLGGVLNLLAAIQEPSLFKMVIVLDSPLINRMKSEIIKFSKSLGFIDRITPAFRTRGRRQHWATKDEVLGYLKSRTLFKTFTDACLDDYIEFGMEKNDLGYSLRFDPKIEYQIFRTIPHILPKFEGQLTVPTVLLYGNMSTVVDFFDRRYMTKHYGIHCLKAKGTHMFPMEYPEETAVVIKALVEQYLGGNE